MGHAPDDAGAGLIIADPQLQQQQPQQPRRVLLTAQQNPTSPVTITLAEPLVVAEGAPVITIPVSGASHFLGSRAATVP